MVPDVSRKNGDCKALIDDLFLRVSGKRHSTCANDSFHPNLHPNILGCQLFE